jgi:hypothetical protein
MFPKISPKLFVVDLMRTENTDFLAAVAARGCPVQIGLDMLFERIPAYLEYFGLPTMTPDGLDRFRHYPIALLRALIAVLNIPATLNFAVA